MSFLGCLHIFMHKHCVLSIYTLLCDLIDKGLSCREEKEAEKEKKQKERSRKP